MVQSYDTFHPTVNDDVTNHIFPNDVTATQNKKKHPKVISFSEIFKKKN